MRAKSGLQYARWLFAWVWLSAWLIRIDGFQRWAERQWNS